MGDGLQRFFESHHRHRGFTILSELNRFGPNCGYEDECEDKRAEHDEHTLILSGILPQRLESSLPRRFKEHHGSCGGDVQGLDTVFHRDAQAGVAGSHEVGTDSAAFIAEQE